MSYIRIISTKVIAAKNLHAASYAKKSFVNYINHLSQKASDAPGFISSNSYWKKGDLNTIISISDWTTENKWDKWVSSPERNLIHHEYKSIIGHETFDILIKKQKKRDVFLL